MTLTASILPLLLAAGTILSPSLAIAQAHLHPRKLAVTEDGDTIYVLSNGTWKFKVKGATPLVDIDGNRYRSTLIGDQVWMAENLRTTRFRDGTAMANLESPSAWRAARAPAYVAYGNDTSLVADYGLLYNWFAVADAKQLCPEGWRMPTRQDWEELLQFVGPLRPTPDVLRFDWQRGGPLLEAGVKHWETSGAAVGDPVGFSARGAGYRAMAPPRDFFALKRATAFWTSEITGTDPYFVTLVNTAGSGGGGHVHNYTGNNPRESRTFGLSVRCLRIEQYKPFPPVR